MSDISHVFGYDLSISSGGDLAVVSGTDFGVQRVTRRLCTNSGGYIFSLDYGAGLPARIGNADTLADITAVVLEQMKLEASVSQTVEPSVSMTDLGNGTRKINIKYSDSNTNQSVIVEL